ncbi:DeoR/GlpR family DNA-binding transcription regulator [Exiguobacterium flavidum]|uniref:DeoR/GlpR family DNA-binding transcription regulator n=1 Tax=Exiguobacterium flavidum TaxID=2184695 RepID=UPI000DF7AE49|nr:DeoR/GlpR family DNA-binding transcription regulator [Exiguobacterium flavidum]
MLTKQRHQVILELVGRNEIVKMQEIVERTGASESTIRRDLTRLEEAGYLRRVHGGATANHMQIDEPSYLEKSDRHIEEKDAIARVAAERIEDGMYVYLDAGTTTLAIVPYLEGKMITVVTNSLPLANTLLYHRIPTFVVGGQLKHSTQAMVGFNAREGMMIYHFDVAFLGMNGVHPAHGFTTPDPEEALVKKTAIELAKRTYVLVDETKLDQISFSKVAPLEAASIITGTSQEAAAKYRQFTEVVNVR